MGGPHGSFWLLVLVATTLLAQLAGAQPWQACVSRSGNYTSNSIYQSNIKLLAEMLPKNASRDLYARASVGGVPDIVYALALCRGDMNASACASCVATAFVDAQQLCPFNKDATVYYDECYLRFSNANFLDRTSNDNIIALQNPEQVSSLVPAFDAAVGALLNATADYAAANSTRRFATGERSDDIRTNPTIYGLTQCTPDLSEDNCRSCLEYLLRQMPQYLNGRKGGRMIGIRCNIRYEVYSFFSSAPSLTLAAAPPPAPANATPAATPSQPAGRSGRRTRIVLAIALPIVTTIVAVTLVSLCLLRRRRRRRILSREYQPSYPRNAKDTESIDSLLLDISTLCAATDNFAESNKLGEGRFGTVYKGVLPNGQEIAVKRLSENSVQGIQELKNELVLVTKLQHKNLVRLIGVSLQEHEKLLVYEYMPNKSMDTILYDTEKFMQLDWGKRSNIINGIVRGLQYLHEDSQLKIIHRDLKASNVLLDSNYTPKISDFGLARLLVREQSQEVTKRIVGTYGYMAPEYALRGHYSVKSDVFSFGILILEIVTRKRCGSSINMEKPVNILSPVWEHWTTGTIFEMIDSSLRSKAPVEQVLKYIHIGLLCVQDNPADRPTMSTINVMLSSSTISLPAPLKPICSESHPRTIQSPDFPGLALTPNIFSITELEPRYQDEF